MMKTVSLKIIACLAMLLAGSLCATASSPSTFVFSKSGIASVKIGADYTRVPTSCTGLYAYAKLSVCCGGEDGEGVEIYYYTRTSADPIIRACLKVDDATVNALYDRGMACQSYLVTNTKMANLLRRTGSTKIEYISVFASPQISVNIKGKAMATTEPATKFIKLPGAVTTAYEAEGLHIRCEIGDLTMETNAYDALTPKALSAIEKKFQSAIENGYFEPEEPVVVTPADVNPSARFSYFYYSPDE